MILDIESKLNAELNYGKVIIKPEMSTRFGFGLNVNNINPFVLDKIEGKGKLNIEYTW